MDLFQPLNSISAKTIVDSEKFRFVKQRNVVALHRDPRRSEHTMPFDALRRRVQKETGRATGSNAPLRLQHTLDPALGRGNDEHAKTLEAPGIGEPFLLAGVEIGEQLLGGLQNIVTIVFVPRRS